MCFGIKEVVRNGAPEQELEPNQSFQFNSGFVWNIKIIVLFAYTEI